MTGRRFHRTSLKAPLLPDLVKQTQKGGRKGLHARYDAVLPRLISARTVPRSSSHTFDRILAFFRSISRVRKGQTTLGNFEAFLDRTIVSRKRRAGKGANGRGTLLAAREGANINVCRGTSSGELWKRPLLPGPRSQSKEDEHAYHYTHIYLGEWFFTATGADAPGPQHRLKTSTGN